MSQDTGLAIDVGGTFTDVVLYDGRRRQFRFAKVLTTPADPSVGSVAGARALLKSEAVEADAITRIVHATTVATNAVLERKGARIGLITTKGFRDTLAIGREYRYDIYDLNLRMPTPLVPQSRRLEVNERVGESGAVITPLDDADVRRALIALVDEHEVSAIAVTFLNSFERPEHELRVREIGSTMYPHIVFSLSHEVAGEIREYERTSTTVIDAYVKPLVREYVQRLSEGLAGIGLSPKIAMMLSTGGVAPAVEVADAFPVRILESGPAAGAIGAAKIAALALDPANAIAFDMGGTTAKISVILDGKAQVTNEFEVGHVHRFKRGSGLALQLSAIELLEIGAGGGSIAHINALGLLKVGPHSAGAAPGPACYGLGGTAPCVTDADLLLGYLDPEGFLGGDLKLQSSRAAQAMDQALGATLEMSTEQIAWGVHDMVNENMAAATRAHAAETGIDLREFSFIAFGGAGPVHAYSVARKLGIRRVVCPVGAGVASAIGCLVAPGAIDQVKPLSEALAHAHWEQISAEVEVLEERAMQTLSGLVHAPCEPSNAAVSDGNAASTEISLDIRCRGQGFSVCVELPASLVLNADATSCISALFERRYRAVYGHAPPDVPTELVNLRTRTVAGQERLPELDQMNVNDEATNLEAARKGCRDLYFGDQGGRCRGDVYDRYSLPRAVTLRGPAVIEERETTAVVGPNAGFTIDPYGNLVIEIDG
ncbi:MAG: N-methylhydantoinase A [Gammaproteobacteria bacterium]|jgi:N-methylhydantoinase A